MTSSHVSGLLGRQPCSMRIKAFLIHLGFSCIIAIVATILVFGIWYPPPLNDAVGATEIFVLILLVDATLGPLLTLILYVPGKRGLVFDLWMIAVLQVGALAYGLWAVASERPAWVVFNADRFDLVQASAIDTRYLDLADPLYRSPPWTGPRWVGAKPSEDRERRNAMMLEAAVGGSDIPHHPELYQPLENLTDTIRGRAFPLDRLYDFNRPLDVMAQLQKWPEATAWVPLMARARPMTVLLDQRYQVVAVVALNPWD